MGISCRPEQAVGRTGSPFTHHGVDAASRHPFCRTFVARCLPRHGRRVLLRVRRAHNALHHGGTVAMRRMELPHRLRHGGADAAVVCHHRPAGMAVGGISALLRQRHLRRRGHGQLRPVSASLLHGAEGRPAGARRRDARGGLHAREPIRQRRMAAALSAEDRPPLQGESRLYTLCDAERQCDAGEHTLPGQLLRHAGPGAGEGACAQGHAPAARPAAAAAPGGMGRPVHPRRPAACPRPLV